MVRTAWREASIRAVALGAVTVFPVVAWAAEPPTFTKDIAPIFQEKCEACHRPESIAPMSLMTYQEARPWARSIKTRVASRQMPPWHIDKTIGIQAFKNDRSLTDAQIDTIVRWVDAGAPMGNPSDMPPAKVWPDESVWNYAALFGGPPDLVITSPPFSMPAVSQDAWYRPRVPTGLTEPRWVRAIEIRPSTVKGRKITHHAIARLVQEEPGAADNDDAGVGPGLFMEWAVGKQGELMRSDNGKLMLPGSQIQFDLHYSAGGEDITDSVELGIYFYPKGQEPKYRQSLASFSGIQGGARNNVDIPPNSIWASQNVHILKENGRVESFQPHMHLRGKAMLMEAIYPDGRTEVLSHVNNFNFNWHNTYVYADDAAPLLPKGSLLRITTWFDNTAANPNNPDPRQWVGWGDRTVDEMSHAWVNVTYMGDEDFQAELEKRKASATQRTQQQQ
jgi:hypothetical protein